MKNAMHLIWGLCLAMTFYSCTLDNYEEPEETLQGAVVDVATGDTVLTDQGSEGIRVRMRELSWKGGTQENLDFFCMKEGTFRNTKVFKGEYNVRVDGPFIPIVRLDVNGDTLADESKYVTISGKTEVTFEVQPFLKVEWVGEPSVKDGKITATMKVTRAVSPADFKAKVEPMGGYSDDLLQVTDVRLFVSQVPYVGFREWDNRYSTMKEYSGTDFETQLGQPITLTTSGVIPSGRTVFIRAAARINYATEGIKRYNYNAAVRVDVP